MYVYIYLNSDDEVLQMYCRCAQVIADDAIHVLINLNSHTAGERNGIFAFRPAPVQVYVFVFICM